MAAPILAAAGLMLAPLIGGAMTLAGGAMSMTGGLVHAASTATGMAFDMGKGAMGAIGGLGGGDNGKSGNVEDTSVVAADQSRSDALGRKALPPGTKMNKNGVIIRDKGGPQGGQVLPGQFGEDGKLLSLDDRLATMEAPDRSGASPMQQILDHVKNISANTARTAAGVLSLQTNMGLLVQSSINTVSALQTDSATDKRDENLAGAETGGGSKGPGRIASGLSKGWDKVKDTLSSVGTGFKMALKALALFGIFKLYQKYRTNIRDWMAGIFETFDEWYHILKESDNPWETAWEGIKTWGIGVFKTVMDWIKLKSIELFNFIYDTVTDFANNILWGPKGDKAITKETTPFIEAGASLESISAANKAAGGTGDLGFLTSEGSVDSSDNELSIKMRAQATSAARKRWTAMYNKSRASDWAIQWTKVPFMHAGVMNWDMLESDPTTSIQSTGQKVLMASIMSSQPILGGDILSQSALNNPNLLSEKLGITSGMSKENQAGILANAAKASTIRWIEQNRKNTMAQAHGAQEFETVQAHTQLDGQVLGTLKGLWEHINPDSTSSQFKKMREEADKEIALLKQLSVEEFNAIPIKERADILRASAQFYKDARKDSKNHSIFTHDSNVIELLKPVSKAFADGKQTAPLIMAPDNRNQSVTKLGDSYSGGLSSRVQDSTARMLAYTKNLNSTTGQFA